MRKTVTTANIPVQGFIRFSQKEPLENLTSVINQVQPRKPDYDVIKDINERFTYCIQYYEEQIAEEKKELSKHQRAINEALSTVEAFGGRYTTKIDQFNDLGQRLQSDEVIGSTFFGSGNKIKNVELFWQLYNQQIAVFDEIEVLYLERGNAYDNLIENVYGSDEVGKGSIACQRNIAEHKDKQKRLQDLQAQFVELVKDFDPTITPSDKKSSGGKSRSQKQTNAAPAAPPVQKVPGCDYCAGCKFKNDDWCSWNSCSITADLAGCSHKQ
jgi:hypothetical protein